MDTTEQRIRNIIAWTEEDREFYKDFFSGIVGKKMEEIWEFAKTIEGDINTKMKAVKEKFPEQFE
jgi:predicted Abi (CAAX) family protease